MTLLPKPAIPTLPGSTDPNVKRAINAIRDYLNSLKGTLDATGVTSGTAVVTTGGGSYVPGDGGGGIIVVEDPGTAIAQPVLSVTGLYGSLLLEWTIPLYDHLWLAYTEVYWNTEDDLDSASLLTQVPVPQVLCVHTPSVLLPTTTYYYWVRHVTVADRIGPWNDAAGTPGTTASDPSYLLELLAGRLGYGNFDVANGIFPVRVVDALPILPHADWPVGSLAFFLGDGKLYRNVSNVWTAAVSAGDIDGDITGDMIGDGEISANHILANSITAGKIAAGAILASHVGANEIISNSLNVKNGVITNAKIGSVNADKIYAASGTIADVLIGNGHIDNAKIGNVIQAKTLIGGQPAWSINKLGGIDGRNITIRDSAGTIVLSSGSGVSASSITGLGNFAFLNSITTSNVSTYIASGAIGNAHIANAAITTAKIKDANVATLKIGNNAVIVPASVKLATSLFTDGSNRQLALTTPTITPYVAGANSPAVALFVTCRVQGYTPPGDNNDPRWSITFWVQRVFAGTTTDILGGSGGHLGDGGTVTVSGVDFPAFSSSNPSVYYRLYVKVTRTLLAGSNIVCIGTRGK